MGPAGGGGGRRGLTGLVMVGGIGRIARVSSGLVPAMALLYLGGGAAVLAARADQIRGDGTDLLLGAPTGGHGKGRNGIHPGCRSAVRGGPGGVHQ